MRTVNELLKGMLEEKGSDLHLMTGQAPRIRVHGELEPIEGEPVSEKAMLRMLKQICPPHRWEEYLQTRDIDFAYEIPGLARFRCNYLFDYSGMAAVLRQIPSRILSMEDLKLPDVLRRICEYQHGLVLVTGPTGSGKSTTMAAMIDYINRNFRKHIITIEDPIEFVHQDRNSIIIHREVGEHSRSFAEALRSATRGDPDIVLVGEMRELETIRLALNCAAMGMLVFGTLHTNSAPKTIERIINVFPHGQQEQIRMLLSEGLKGVIAQNLLRRTGGGRVAALEVMVGTPAVNNLIRENKVFMIKSSIQTGKSLGMQTMDQSLLDLVQRRLVAVEEAMRFAEDKSIFRVERPGPKGAK